MALGSKRPVVTRMAVCVAMLMIAVGCGGGGAGPAPLAIGKEAVVDHTQLSGASPAPTTKLAITVLAVRTGTIAELEAGGFELSDAQKAKTPTYVDARFKNRGTAAIDKHLGVSLEDQDGNLITSVAVINLGGDTYQPCPDNGGSGSLAPGEKFDTCDLFLVPSGKTASKVSFLPNTPGKATDFIYWSVR